MGKSLCMISFGLFALVFMFAFQNSDAQACGRYHPVGSLDSFTYSNSSAVTVEWRLETAYDGNKSIICNFTSRVCSSHPELSANVSMGTTVCTINQMQTNYKSLYVVVDGSETLVCRELNIYAHPEKLTCLVSQAGYSPATISFNATKFFPSRFNVFYFISNGADVMFSSSAFYSSGLQVIPTPNGSLPYYNQIRPYDTVSSRLLRRGTNIFFISMRNGDGTDPGINSSFTSIDIYPAISSFLANGSTSLPASLNAVVVLACNVEPVPAENISLSRRRLGEVLNTTMSGDGKSITYVMPPFQCSDIDEYVCTVDDGQRSNASKITVYSYLCPPELIGKNNVSLTTENGGSIYLPLKVYSYSSVSATLWFIEDGVRYRARQTLYTSYTESTSTYFYNLNVALLDIRDSDFRDYILIITNGAGGDGLRFYFTASKETSVDVRGVAIGVGVVAIALLIVVVVLVLLLCRCRRRRASQKQFIGAEMVQPQNYDSTETSWGIERKSREAAAPDNRKASLPVRAATSKTEPTYEPMTENSKPHRPPLPPPQEDVYEIEPNGENSRPQSYYGNVHDQPIYGNM